LVPRRRLAPSLLALGLTASAVLLVPTTAPSGGLALASAYGSGVKPVAGGCPPGTAREAADDAETGSGVLGPNPCSPLGVEGTKELSTAHAQLDARRTAPFTSVAAGAYASAVAAKGALAASAGSSPGTWHPVGSTPLNSDEPGYSRTNGLGLHQLSGRIEDLATDPADAKHLYAAVAGGGLFTSTDAGTTWTSVGDSLPTQVTGAIAVVPAKGGAPARLVLGTGDPAYGGSSEAGLGVFTSTDNGATWAHAPGSPTDGLTFVLRQRPDNPQVIYAGTSKGLYRSVDGGASFANVVLPTGCTDLAAADCFFDNMVTDVAVQAGTGKVVAAVGWRAGRKKNANGNPQSRRNGLYTSATGAPGSFTYQPPSGSGVVGTSGFGRTGTNGGNFVGRTTLGVANGAGQDHGYLVALVEDTGKFNGNGGADTLDVALPAAVPFPTVLDGIYASADFGATWTKVVDAAQLATPDTGTALVGANTPTYEPGVQSWYNQWIEFDPTHLGASGKPDRVLFGLEEVWETTLAVTAVPGAGTAGGAGNNRVIGQYFAGTSCAGLNLGLPACPLSTRSPAAHSTTHPDQHAGLLVPDATGGGVTAYVGNDGGAYAQHVAKGADFTQDGWGNGINTGLHTLQPYQAAVAKDGTIYAGLQDNGEEKITPKGRQIAVFGGDGFFTAVDPDNSNTAYEEYTAGDVAVTTNGGMAWTDINPKLTSPLFATPFVMDSLDATHLLIGGRDVQERQGGPSGTWTKVYDLGTRTQPGVASATSSAGNPNNSTSATDLYDQYGVVGFCGYCDIVTGGLPFGSGIATNVLGDKPAKRGTSDGWHIAAAKGLPLRYVTGVKLDPQNPAVIYATLGGYGRRWIPPGSLGDDTSKVGSGHVFRSGDGGATFVDISGDLPDVPANAVTVHDGNLLVATDIGVFTSSGTRGGSWQVFGSGLPNVAVFSLTENPGKTSQIVAATYGRGVYALDGPSTDGGAAPTLPEAPLAVVLPVAALGLLGVGLVARRRRRGHRAVAA